MDWNTLWLPTATALGLALLHSLWIGALIFALIKTLLPFLSRAGQRHNLAYVGLVALAAGTITAFNQNFDYAPVCENLIATSVSLAELGLTASSTTPEITFTEQLLALLPSLAPWVSIVYLFGLLPAAVYLLRDQRRVQFLRKQGLTKLPASWSGSISGELQRHPATQRVTTYLSQHAGEVMTLGFWSPVIVFPVALVNSLTPEMARTILLHEIAHLRHYDHWLNYPQQFLRTLFFFHPAAHGLCRIIDREREHRCDDWVAARCADRRTYATALVTVARTSINPTNTLVMSATKTPFSHRIQRLFQGEEQRRGHAAFSLLFVGLLAIGHLSFTSLGADAGAVDCLEEQGNDTAPAEVEFNPVILDVDGEEINIPLVEELPASTAVTIQKAVNPPLNNAVFTEALAEAIIDNFQPQRSSPAVANLPRTLVSSIPFADTIPPHGKKETTQSTIKIRSTGDKKPLFVIDGVKVGQEVKDAGLDPDDIKSIKVFKGQTAIDRFGLEGTNGVVVINTKNSTAKSTEAPAIDLEEVVKEKTAVEITGDTKEDGPNPLLVIDGEVLQGEITDHVGTDNIESVTVLKGKSATSRYGIDGANGVVMVKTKGKAKTSATKITYKATSSFTEKVIKSEDGETPTTVTIVTGYRKKDETPDSKVTGYFRTTTVEAEENAEANGYETPETTTLPALPENSPKQKTFTGENNPVEVFPNPGSGLINFRNVPTQAPLNVTVYSRFGEVVRQEKFNGSNVNVQGLPAGNYVIVLSDGTQRWVNQVTVTK